MPLQMFLCCVMCHSAYKLLDGYFMKCDEQGSEALWCLGFFSFQPPEMLKFNATLIFSGNHFYEN